MLPNPSIEPNATGKILNIAPRRLAEIGHLIDKADACRKKTIGRIFDEFGRPTGRDEKRHIALRQRTIELLHHRRRALVFNPDDDPVGMQKIIDCRTLAQEFRIGSDGELGVADFRRR